MLDSKPLGVEKKFCHLGSAVNSTTSLDDEICVRIGKAATAFGGLRCEPLVVPCSLAKTKIRIYEACIMDEKRYLFIHTANLIVD